MKASRGTPDFLLLFMTLALIGFGISMVFSASSILAFNSKLYNYDSTYFVERQIQWFIIGFILMLVAMNIPSKFFKKYYRKIGGISFALLLLVYVPGLGMTLNGAKGWIGIGGMTFQPLEAAKLGLIICLAGIITKKGEKMFDFKQGLLPTLIVAGTFFLAVVFQPDLGGAVILLTCAFIVIFCGGARFKHIFTLGLPILVFIIIFIAIESYRMDRITSYMDPWNDGKNGLGNGYQLIQSYYAIANGGMTGTGFGKSIQKYMYLPYPQTDFIFAVISEELGFIGSFLFLLFFALFLWRMLYITSKCQDTFSNLVGVGMVSMLGFQTAINVGGVTGAIPITGVTLPFVSYGGTSLMVIMAGMGVILSISRDYYKEKEKKNEIKEET